MDAEGVAGQDDADWDTGYQRGARAGGDLFVEVTDNGCAGRRSWRRRRKAKLEIVGNGAAFMDQLQASPRESPDSLCPTRRWAIDMLIDAVKADSPV